MFNDNVVDSEEYKGFTINIMHDDSPQNPRTEWDNFATMACWHNRYNLGDEQESCDIIDWLCDMLDIDEPREYSDNEFTRLQSLFLDKYIAKNLFLYEHGGITMSTGSFSCHYDSGQVGFIYVSKEKVRNEYGWKRITKERKQQVLDLLESEVNVYDHYLTGEVFGFDCEIDSCWGYFGDESIPHMIKECKRIIDSHIEETLKEERQVHFKILKKWIKSKVPFQYRKPLILSY